MGVGTGLRGEGTHWHPRVDLDVLEVDDQSCALRAPALYFKWGGMVGGTLGWARAQPHSYSGPCPEGRDVSCSALCDSPRLQCSSFEGMR